MNETAYRILQSVTEDSHSFRPEVEKFLSGETSAAAFRAIRVTMGIYEQRENDTYMVRVRGAAGIFLPQQAKRLAELAEEYGSGVVHVTTRQDLQIHRVLIENTPAVLERLQEVGLSTRGAGGNTVRNVTSCPNAGVCADEVFDVAPYAVSLTEYLLENRANFNLPRKFKIAFSGCGKDCALCSAADLGFFAHERNGVQGFAVYAGGGMGAHSSLAVRIEEFIPDGVIFEVAEAVKRIFDKHGDRTNRHKARLRFLLERVGAEEFRRMYREELELLRNSGVGGQGMGVRRKPEVISHQLSVTSGEATGDELPVTGGEACHPERSEGSNYTVQGTAERDTVPTRETLRSAQSDMAGRPQVYTDQTSARQESTGPSELERWISRNVTPQKQQGLFRIRIPLALGDIGAASLKALADLAAGIGDGSLRATQEQDLQLRGIPEDALPPLYEMLRRIDQGLVRIESLRTVACAGASTCRVGLCLSRNLAQAIETEMEGVEVPFDEPIRISGCPNSCGQHRAAPIGLYGGAMRVNRKLMPLYSIVVGGRMEEGNARLAEPVARVPARTVPVILREFWIAAVEDRKDGESLNDLIDRWGAGYLRELARKHGRIPSYEDAPECYCDFGSDGDLRLTR